MSPLEIIICAVMGSGILIWGIVLLIKYLKLRKRRKNGNADIDDDD